MIDALNTRVGYHGGATAILGEIQRCLSTRTVLRASTLFRVPAKVAADPDRERTSQTTIA